jgi:hypothetical protein
MHCFTALPGCPAKVTPLCRGALTAQEALRGGAWLHGQCCRGVALMSLQGCFWCATAVRTLPVFARLQRLQLHKD